MDNTLYDLNIEKAILGCLIENPKNIMGENAINPKWFYSSLHKKLFSTIRDLFVSNKPVDIVTLKSLSGDEFLIQEIIDTEYVLGNYDSYVDILKEKYLLREINLHLPDKISSLHKSGAGVAESIGAISSKIKDLMDEIDGRDNLIHFGKVGIDVMKSIKKVRESGVPIFSISTSLKDLNEIVPGYLGGQMIVIAGRPGSGKTSLMMQIAMDNAKKGNSVGIISLEMDKRQLFLRQLAGESGISFMRLLKGELTDTEWSMLANIWKDINQMPIYIDDTSSMNEIDLYIKAKRMKDNYGIKALFVDYLQLLNGSRGDNRQQEITKISRQIVSISKDLDVPVFALSQLNREVDKRENKRPRLSDLRESGCLTGDTIIVDADTGKRRTIKDIVDNKDILPISVMSLDKDYKVRKFNITNAFYSGKKKVFRLTTESGRTIKASANHKFHRIDGWIRLDKLSIGDKIAIPSMFESNIYWDRIKSIEEIGFDDVYDLTVDGVHNFVANDIIVHNSIEQDAYIVMMLYNPSYYNITAFEDGTPTSGIVEIGVEKFRNGKTGWARVAFLAERMKFGNLAYTGETT